jgi:hypothetical protein
VIYPFDFGGMLENPGATIYVLGQDGIAKVA